MKALKEKRISLRSLWRRGLVILSLFALVFASCGDSSSGGDSDSGGPRVVRFTVLTNPANDQYLGQPLDLTGVTLDVFTADGNRYTETDITKIDTYPRVVNGEYDYDKANDEYFFIRHTSYRVIYKGVPSDNNLSLKDVPFWYIYRSDTKSSIYDQPSNIGVVGSMDLGVHLTGASNLRNEAYADDDTFDLRGLALEADYVKWNDSASHPEIRRKEISLSNVSWEIKPRYDQDAYNARGGDNGGYYDGFVYITVGRQNEANIGPVTYPPLGNEENIDPLDSYAWNAGGITVMLPLEKVWTVKSIDAIKLVVDADTQKKLETYFYWEENTYKSWLDRLGDDAKLEITYTNNVTQTKRIKDLAGRERIYLNSNPYEGGLPEWWDDHGIYHGEADFDIMTIQYPITKKSADLGVILYYRGGQYKVPVNVYATLVSVSADPAIEFWPDPNWDNDVDNGAGGPLELSKKLTVKALYAAINDANKQEEATLTYWYDPDVKNKGVSPDFRAYGAGPYYVFGKTSDNDPYSDEDPSVIAGNTYGGDSTYLKGYQKYLNNQLKGKDTTTNVTIYHTMTVEDITGRYEKVFKDRWNDAVTQYDNLGDPFIDLADAWTDHDPYGMLPNGWSPYNPDNKKGPWQVIIRDVDGNVLGKDFIKSRNFGPKLIQNKKTKVAVTWVNHK